MIQAGQQAKASDVLDLARSTSWMSHRKGGRIHFSMPYIMTMAAIALTANTLYTTPFFGLKAATITKIGLYIATGDSGKKARLGIYEGDDDVYPGDLVSDCGEIDVNSGGLKEITGLNIAIAGKLYWFVIISDGSPQITRINPAYAWNIIGSVDYTTGNLKSSWQKSNTYGSLPDPFPASATASDYLFPIGVYLS